MSSNQHQQLLKLLAQLEQNLKSLNLWSDTPPTPESLMSSQPFMVDTLTFEQWLSLVLVPKLAEMAKAGLLLPSAIALCPMAEESFSSLAGKEAELVNLLADIDELLSGERQQTKFLTR